MPGMLVTLHCHFDPQVKVLLGKVQAVFDLPRRLHAAIDHGALEIAVATYADAEPLLRRYGHKVRVRRRREDCHMISVASVSGLP